MDNIYILRFAQIRPLFFLTASFLSCLSSQSCIRCTKKMHQQHKIQKSKSFLEISEENSSPSRLMTNTSNEKSQYKRKGIEDVFTLQLFSVTFDHFPGNRLYYGSNFCYNYFSTITCTFLHLMPGMIHHRVTEIR